jgi:hypothetical protein
MLTSVHDREKSSEYYDSESNEKVKKYSRGQEVQHDDIQLWFTLRHST